MPHAESAILTAPEETQLLFIARTALETFVNDSVRIDLRDQDYTPAMTRKRACFITLRTPDDDLRGCIGSTVHASPLVQSVRDNTIKTATRDPRFDPVTPDELSGLTIEVSALADGDNPGTPFRRVQSLDEILIGRDGLYLEFEKQGRGLLLPQVASERDWNTQEFVEALCRKSGLPSGAVDEPRAILYRFSVHKFDDQNQ